MMIITLTPAEERGVIKTSETWANQTIDAQAVPVIALVMPKEHQGKDVLVLRAAEYSKAQIKISLQIIIDNL